MATSLEDLRAEDGEPVGAEHIAMALTAGEFVYAAVREGNAALVAGDQEAIDRLLGELRAMLDVLGLDSLAEPWAEHADAGDEYRDALGKLVDIVLEQRELARARKDYATADALRDGPATAGVGVEDSSTCPTAGTTPRSRCPDCRELVARGAPPR